MYIPELETRGGQPPRQDLDSQIRDARLEPRNFFPERSREVPLAVGDIGSFMDDAHEDEGTPRGGVEMDTPARLWRVAMWVARGVAVVAVVTGGVEMHRHDVRADDIRAFVETAVGTSFADSITESPEPAKQKQKTPKDKTTAGETTTPAVTPAPEATTTPESDQSVPADSGSGASPTELPPADGVDTPRGEGRIPEDGTTGKATTKTGSVDPAAEAEALKEQFKKHPPTNKN